MDSDTNEIDCFASRMLFFPSSRFFPQQEVISLYKVYINKLW